MGGAVGPCGAVVARRARSQRRRPGGVVPSGCLQAGRVPIGRAASVPHARIPAQLLATRAARRKNTHVEVECTRKGALGGSMSTSALAAEVLRGKGRPAQDSHNSPGYRCCKWPGWSRRSPCGTSSGCHCSTRTPRTTRICRCCNTRFPWSCPNHSCLCS